jgi:hypothetical protein
MDSCIICYEDNNLILPKNYKCKCKYSIHQLCFDKMKEISQIDCPICRNKIYRNYNFDDNYQFNFIFFPRFLYFGFLLLLLILSVWIFIIIKLIYNKIKFFIMALYRLVLNH